MKLLSKTIISGNIKLETGLHIGGSKSSLDIGGMDSPVIKTPHGIPYIPGSSLKGKLRALLAAVLNGNDNNNEHDDTPTLKKMFGYAGKNKLDSGAPAEQTRLIIRDAYLDVEKFNEDFTAKDAILETEFTQEKAENSIDRKNGKAANPRFIERVPAGAVFNFEMVLNNFDEDKDEKFIEILKQGMKLLQDDYIGGSGTRGYGKIKMEIVNEEEKSYAP